MSKVAKWRACPVAKIEIRAAECGSGRHSVYQCPEECQFNPFTKANYDQLLQIEAKVDALVMDLFRTQWQTRPWLLSKFNQALEEGDVLTVNSLVNTTVFIERDANGKSLADHFIEKGMPELKNDERVMFKAKTAIEPMLLEIHQIIDDLFIKAIDLFHPERGNFLIADRSMAATVPRFQVGFGWTYGMPHFRRTHGMMFSVGEFAELEHEQVIKLVLDHLGCPAEGEERRRWLIENAPRLRDALGETALARNQRMMQLTDMRMARARYEIVGHPETACEALDDRSDIETDDRLTEQELDEGFYDGWVWFETPIPEETNVGADSSLVVLGRVLISEKEWRLETLRATKMPELKRRFEQAVGASAKFVLEEEIDLTPDETRPFKKDLIVPALVDTARPLTLQTSRVAPLQEGETAAERVAEVTLANHRAFLDDHIPALGGLTPREAAQAPQSRSTLIRLMKQRIRDVDQCNLETGRQDDINGIVKELSLHEIDFAPPPLRRIPDYVRNAVAPGAADNLPPAPRLPSEPLSEAAIAKRLKKTARHYSSPAEHLSALALAGGTGPHDLEAILGKFLNDQELSVALMAITNASFVLVPPGYQFPFVDLDRVDTELTRTIQEVRFDEKSAARPISNPARQPMLIAALNELLLMHTQSGELRPEAAVAIATFLTAYTNELDRQLRD